MCCGTFLFLVLKMSETIDNCSRVFGASDNGLRQYITIPCYLPAFLRERSSD